MSAAELNDEQSCDCDYVEIVVDAGERFELHHVIPDDGAPHVASLECGCNPDIDRDGYQLIVVDHRDQDVDTGDEAGACSFSAKPTGAGSAP